MESTGEDDVKIVETTAEDLECYINVFDKAATRIESIYSFERVSSVDKILSTSSACDTEVVCERESVDVATFIVLF